MSATPIRVMLCDDSSVMRRLIVSTVKTVPNILVVSEAVDGRDAINKLPSVRPDVVIMDIKMPVMDGIEAVREIRKADRKLPVIMFSSLTSEGADATMDAVSAGANDFATKPLEVGHIGKAVEHLRTELIPKIYQWGGRPEPRKPNRATLPSTPAARGQSTDAANGNANPAGTPAAGKKALFPTAEAIGIGVSTGGPQVLSAIVAALPKQLPGPIFIVQHMPAAFTGLLAERLAAEQGHRVYEAKNNTQVQPGDIVIAPGDYHMTVSRKGSVVTTHLNQNAPENSCRPSVDPLFRSLAESYGNKCLGVILTGMGKDGTQGVAALREQGAKILVQDKNTSVVWGMPGNVVQAGLADAVVPRDQIASEIICAMKIPN